LRGWNAILWETQRTRERAAMLHKRGTGSLDSMHIYLMAFDVVDGDLNNVKDMNDQPESYWQAPDAFWEDLEDIMVELGITRLFKAGTKHVIEDGKANSWDKPHGQFCPVSEQAKVRKMTLEQCEAYIQQRFAKQLAEIKAA